LKSIINYFIVGQDKTIHPFIITNEVINLPVTKLLLSLKNSEKLFCLVKKDTAHEKKIGNVHTKFLGYTNSLIQTQSKTELLW
jgi:hypothetical protein